MLAGSRMHVHHTHVHLTTAYKNGYRQAMVLALDFEAFRISQLAADPNTVPEHQTTSLTHDVTLTVLALRPALCCAVLFSQARTPYWNWLLLIGSSFNIQSQYHGLSVAVLSTAFENDGFNIYRDTDTAQLDSSLPVSGLCQALMKNVLAFDCSCEHQQHRTSFTVTRSLC